MGILLLLFPEHVDVQLLGFVPRVPQTFNTGLALNS
jgi:hypothetical protein